MNYKQSIKGTRCQQLSAGFQVIAGKDVMQISAHRPSECGLQSFTHPFAHHVCPPPIVLGHSTYTHQTPAESRALAKSQTGE